MKSDESVMMSAEETTRRKCDDPECVDIRKERDLLVASLRDSTHAQLISRDMELGLRAELVQARIDFIQVRDRAEEEIARVRDRSVRDLAMTRASTTWRIGRIVMTPVALAKRAKRRFLK
jgi:hypothetical protein